MERSCLETLERLGDHGRDAEVQAHLASCEQCRADARLLAALAATRQEPDEGRLAAFSLRVTAAHVQQAEHRQRAAPLRAALAAGALAAAAVLLGVGLDRGLPNAPSAGVEPPPAAFVLSERAGAEASGSALSDTEVDAVLADYAGYAELGADLQPQVAFFEEDEGA